MLTSKWSRDIHQQNIQIAVKLEMLKTIIQKKNVEGLLCFEPLALGKAVFADTKGDAALQTEFHQLDFVAGPIGAAVTAAQNLYALPFREELLSEPDHHGRLAGAADGKIAHADDCSL